MSENKICVYAICKNESKFVERWLTSIKDADYIVVLDTGSTDDTYDKFKKYSETNEFTPNSKLIVKQEIISPWRFDVARNLSLDMAYDTDANIFFCLDIDEVIHEGWDIILRTKWVNGTHQRGIYKYTWSHSENGAEGRSFWADKIHSREWVWMYPVHEFLSRSKFRKSRYTKEETLYLFNDIHVEHYPDKNKSRSSYLPLLELRLEENPDDIMTMMYLGHEYYYRGIYDKSISTLNKVLELLTDNTIDVSSCYLFIADCYRKINDNTKAINSYTTAINKCPTYIEPYIGLGKLYIDINDYSKAVSILKLGISTSIRYYSWLERDTSWSYGPWDLLSIAEFYSGNKKDSLLHAIKAYSYDKENTRLQSNIDCILNNIKNTDLL